MAKRHQPENIEETPKDIFGETEGMRKNKKAREAKQERAADNQPVEEAEKIEDETLPETEPEASQPPLEKLTDHLETLPSEVRKRVRQAIDGLAGDYRLEKGRYLFRYLIRRQQVSIDDTRDKPATITYKVALYRQTPPVPSAEVTDEAMKEVAAEHGNGLSSQAVMAKTLDSLAPEDELVVQWSDDGETKTLKFTAAKPVPERPPAEPAGDDSQLPERLEDLAGQVETAAQLAEASGETETPLVSEDEFAAAVDRVWQEPEPVQDKAKPRQPATDSEQFATLVTDLAEHGDLLADLPPIAGAAEIEEPDDFHEPGIPEGETEAEQVVEPPTVEQPVPEDQPAPDWRQSREAPRPRRQRRRPRIVPVMERRWPEPKPLPSDDLRRKARKFLRVMAAKYGVRLSPERQAYLLAILLRPAKINGRTVYGLGVNRETFLAVLMVLRLNYQGNRPT